MIFLNTSFIGDGSSVNISISNITEVNQLYFANGVFDNAYITNDTNEQIQKGQPSTWTYNTILRVDFNENILGGSLSYTLSHIDGFMIKRRPLGSFNWLTLEKVTIHTKEDLKFEFFDKYTQSNTVYEYALFPISSSVVGVPIVKTVYSNFSGIFILDNENMYGSILEAKINELRKIRPKAIVTTKGNKYPFVITNGENNYFEGSVSAMFVPVNRKDCSLDIKNSWSYKKNVMEFLQNGQPKIIKDSYGKMFIAVVSDDVILNEEEFPKSSISFNFVEVGNPNNLLDLYDNGLIDHDLITGGIE